METIVTGLRWTHIVLGFIGLGAFWIPVVTRKGGRWHKQTGKVFAICGYVVAGTAIGTCTLRLIGALLEGQRFANNPPAFGFLLFLGYLGWVTLALVHHSVQTVRTRKNPDAIRTPFHHVLAIVPAISSVVVTVYALVYWSRVSIILLVLSPLGFIILRDLWAYMYATEREKMGWFYAHMGAMLGAGVAFHTAFLVFGSSRFLDLSILGSYNWVPWVLPAVVGTIGGSVWERHYRRKFGDLPEQGSAAAGASA